MSLQQGSRLGERYEIVRALQSGGMGAIYEARDTKLANSACAVKEVLLQGGGTEDATYLNRRLQEEMAALASLEHAAIPRVRDFFVDGEQSYIVMDFVRGKNLDEELMDSKSGLDPEQVVKDMLRVLDVLQYLHSHKPAILHRDVKPANIIRQESTGEVKLVDFGLARKVEQSVVQTAIGTPGYCPPEQMIGRAEPRSDLFSVGVTMHCLLTKDPPGIMHFEPLFPQLPGVRPGLSYIVHKATQLKPVDRYFTAAEMAEDLRLWQQGKTPKAMDEADAAVMASTPAAAPVAEPKLPVARTMEPIANPGWSVPMTLTIVGLAVLTGLGLGKLLQARNSERPTPVVTVTASATPAHGGPGNGKKPTPGRKPVSGVKPPVSGVRPPVSGGKPVSAVKPPPVNRATPTPGRPVAVRPALGDGGPSYPTAHKPASSPTPATGAVVTTVSAICNVPDFAGFGREDRGNMVVYQGALGERRVYLSVIAQSGGGVPDRAALESFAAENIAKLGGTQAHRVPVANTVLAQRFALPDGGAGALLLRQKKDRLCTIAVNVQPAGPREPFLRELAGVISQITLK